MPQETLVLLGETGTGKTLTLKLAAGLLRPTQGKIEVLGQEVSAMSERELLPHRRQLGFVFQEGALFDSMSVAENVAYQLRQDRMSEEEIERRVQEVLHFVELEQTVDMLPSELSGGMRRRVSIARALAARPPVMLYDSPTAGLDPVTAQTIITLILRSRDVFGVTAMLATQRVQDGFALANFRFDAESKRVVRLAKRESTVPTGGESSEPVTRFVVYRAGRVYFEGKPEEMAESKDAYLQRFLAGI
jgi:phospholipid/cholesterol/gamma-HCH transport system ATP-binding protein